MKIVERFPSRFVLIWKMDDQAGIHCEHELESTTRDEAMQEAERFCGKDWISPKTKKEKEWREKNKDKVKKYRETYYSKHKQKIKLRNATK